MNKKTLFKYAGVAGLIPLGLPLLNACQIEEKEPNVLLIVSDDQGYADLSCTGLSGDVSTPNIDRLANEGVRFTSAYATSPISNPSRAGIITGSYQERWGTFWYGGQGIHDASYSTLAELLADNNYRTGYFGKVHYGNRDYDTTNRNFPLNHGFEEYMGFTSPRKHYLHHVDSLEQYFQQVKKEYKRSGQSLRQQALWDGTSKLDTIALTTELITDRAFDFIRKKKKEKFFLQLAYNAVHNFTHQLPEEYLKEHGLKGYHDWDPTIEEYYDWYKAGRYPNNPEGRAHYLGQLYYLDREVGRLLDFLDEQGLRENTIVIYISDNGGSTPIYANNAPLRGSKYTLYEGGIRVPMIISWPEKYQSQKVLNNVVSAMDIYPTVCKATNTPVPGNIDGLDLSGLLTGRTPNLCHDTLVWDTHQETAVRMGKWKLRTADKRGHADYEMVELELGEFLYDLEKDPGETRDLKNDFPDIFQNLKNAHKEWRAKIGSPMKVE